MPDPIRDYLKAIEDELSAGTVTEHTYRPALKALVESLRPGLTAINEPGKFEGNAPDFRIILPGPKLTAGHIETKDIGKPLDEIERGEQLKRYLKSLPNLILTDYLEFRWYVDGQRREIVRLARVGATGKIIREKDGAVALMDLLQDFLNAGPVEVKSPKELAERMARLTHLIRDVIISVFDSGKASNELKEMRQAFAETLIPDLEKPEKTGEFADMYAQTIAYGLFAARCSHKGAADTFQRLGAAKEIPKTNPLLRKLFESVTGVDLDDEPYAPFVDDLAGLLAHADMEAILAQFGKRTKQEDPIVHFYETFLAAYDPKLREKRGVYYTPEPVVSYIVRSVDYLLRTRFGLKDGLADTTKVECENASGEKKTSPKVLILDPACGTGTFLYAVVDLIRAQFIQNNDAGMWSDYVREHLLPRLFGFELLMAPYAVAHFKLGLQLAAQDLDGPLRQLYAYDFKGDERLRVYLTNTLEQAVENVPTLWGYHRVITEEANAAAEVKRDLPIMVVLGNPPYSGHSSNKGKWISDLVRDYYFVDGKPLGEKNPKWLQDDYVKFIRWAQRRIDQTGAGILAFITNHGYLDNPTFHGMRQSLMKTFNDIYILDLHGNSKKKEKAPDGGPDENVFDIQQGVAIAILVKEPKATGEAQVLRADLQGTRKFKYDYLSDYFVASSRWMPLTPCSPQYLFVSQDARLKSEYGTWPSIREIFSVNGVGMTTARDSTVVDFEPAPILERARTFRDLTGSDETVLGKLGIPAKKGWNVHSARSLIKAEPNLEQFIKPVNYRPYDDRFIFYHDSLVWRTVKQIMCHMLAGENIGMVWTRPMSPTYEFSISSTRSIIDQCAIGNKSAGAGISYIGPLYLYPTDQEVKMGLYSNDERRANLSKEFIEEFAGKLGLEWVPDGRGDLAKTFGPEDIFHYIYAIFHSPTYRTRYAEFLKIDFPRIPLTSNVEMFRRLCALGADLVKQHLLEFPDPGLSNTGYPVPGDNAVAKGYPKYLAPGEAEPGTGKSLEKGRVYINDKQLFDDVPENVWKFHVGGYQVCQKWLKDRRGRTLPPDDRIHYRKIIIALAETIRLMAEIDAAIPGWPVA